MSDIVPKTQMSPAMTREHELDPVTHERTGRTRTSQWVRQTLRLHAVPPSERGDAPFVAREEE
jgi:hypothetical protein